MAEHLLFVSTVSHEPRLLLLVIKDVHQVRLLQRHLCLDARVMFSQSASRVLLRVLSRFHLLFNSLCRPTSNSSTQLRQQRASLPDCFHCADISDNVCKVLYNLNGKISTKRNGVDVLSRDGTLPRQLASILTLVLALTRRVQEAYTSEARGM